jgi:LacI family transcriptional regulator
MALGVLQAAYRRGLRIPENLGVVGFDNIAESAYFWPALTTIQQDQYEVAKVAVEEIIRIIESGWQGVESIEFKSMKLAPALVVRQSSACLTQSEIDKGGGASGKRMTKFEKNEEELVRD